MPVSPARRLALDVLLAVDAGGYASDLLHSSRSRGLERRDLRLATELVMGTLRWQAQLDFVLTRAAGRGLAHSAPAALAALRLGAYQLRFLDRVPAVAAVHESVEMAKAAGRGAAGFVNAVLRHLPLAPIETLLAGEPDWERRRALELSHPAWLLRRWSQQFGAERAQAVAVYDNAPPPTAVRGPGLAALPPPITLVPGQLLADARRVASGDVTQTDPWRRGQVRIQDEASQLMAYLLAPQPGERVLDLCAAPGGKAATLLELAPQAQLTALELHPLRARRLRRLLPPAAAVVVADATRPLPLRGQFERILVDAPCSGTGTLARNPEIRWRLRPSDPARLQRLQFALLRQALAVLAPGGRLVYSVCSIEPEEGEQVMQNLLGADSGVDVVRIGAALEPWVSSGAVRAELQAATTGEFLRIFPGQWATDGFFAAVLERD
ncbi:MAG: transcription antitermination factor NusB [Terriglobales bacterium]